jgi:hypothetical protein
MLDSKNASNDHNQTHVQPFPGFVVGERCFAKSCTGCNFVDIGSVDSYESWL